MLMMMMRMVVGVYIEHLLHSRYPLSSCLSMAVVGTVCPMTITMICFDGVMCLGLTHTHGSSNTAAVSIPVAPYWHSLATALHCTERHCTTLHNTAMHCNAMH